MALITAANFRQHYPQLTGTGEDTVLDALIARADALMAAWCGFRPYDGSNRSLTSQSYALKYSAPSAVDPRALCLCARPLSAVSAVEVDVTGFFTGDEEALVEGTDFVVDLEEGILIRADGEIWPVALKGISVEFTAGFSSTPADLVAIAAAEVRHLWNLRNTQGESAYGMGPDSATLADADALIPLAVQQALAPYRVCA
jgi:hypothetical protein